MTLVSARLTPLHLSRTTLSVSPFRVHIKQKWTLSSTAVVSSTAPINNCIRVNRSQHDHHPIDVTPSHLQLGFSFTTPY